MICKNDSSGPATGGRPWRTQGVELPHGARLVANHGGKEVSAVINDGRLLLDGKVFTSVTAAATFVVGSRVRGWDFWNCILPSTDNEVPLRKLARRHSLSRRKFIKGLASAGAVGAPIAAKVADWIKGGLVWDSAKELADPANGLFATESHRDAIARRLFLLDFPSVTIVPAVDHPSARPIVPGGTYANEWRAIQGFRKLRQVAVDPNVDMFGDGVRIYLGSPGSNRFIKATMWEQNLKPRFELRMPKPVRVPYSIEQLSDTVRRLQDGDPNYRVQKRAIVQREAIDLPIAPRRSRDGDLESDWLLFTRAQMAILLTPLHGPGMIAVKDVLFNIDLADLECLANRVGASDCQAIFEIPKLTTSSGTTIPAGVRLVRKSITLLT